MDTVTQRLVFRIDDGHFGDVNLDGLKFAVLLHSPGAMAEGNITVGLITDERASAEQQEAILGIATGQAGGPMAALGPLVGNFAGVELAAIDYDQNGNSRSATVPDLLEQSVKGFPGADPDRASHVENVPHPVASAWRSPRPRRRTSTPLASTMTATAATTVISLLLAGRDKDRPRDICVKMEVVHRRLTRNDRHPGHGLSCSDGQGGPGRGVAWIR